MSDLEKQLRKENEELKAKLSGVSRQLSSFRLGIGDKGGVKVQLGTRRFPVTLYAAEWLLIAQHIEELKAYIQANRPRLAWKDGVVDSD